MENNQYQQPQYAQQAAPAQQYGQAPAAPQGQPQTHFADFCEISLFWPDPTKPYTEGKNPVLSGSLKFPNGYTMKVSLWPRKKNSDGTQFFSGKVQELKQGPAPAPVQAAPPQYAQPAPAQPQYAQPAPQQMPAATYQPVAAPAPQGYQQPQQPAYQTPAMGYVQPPSAQYPQPAPAPQAVDGRALANHPAAAPPQGVMINVAPDNMMTGQSSPDDLPF